MVTIVGFSFLRLALSSRVKKFMLPNTAFRYLIGVETTLYNGINFCKLTAVSKLRKRQSVTCFTAITVNWSDLYLHFCKLVSFDGVQCNIFVCFSATVFNSAWLF